MTKQHRHPSFPRFPRNLSVPFSRRSFLKAAGLGTAACALGSSTKVFGQSIAPAIPRRIVFFHTQQGTLRNLWAPSGSETSFALGELHAAALERHKSSLLFLDGLAMNSNDVDPTGPANAHYAGCTHSMTGVDRQSAAAEHAVDRPVDRTRNDKSSPLTKVPSLELAVRDISFGEWAVSFSPSGAPMPYETDPGAAYDRIFDGFTPPSDAAGQSRAEQDELVLKWAAGAFDPLARKFGQLDREKLEAHAAALRDFRARAQYYA